MSTYALRAVKKVRLTKEEFYYLLPAYNLMKAAYTVFLYHDTIRDGYLFFGLDDDIEDMQKRLEGFYY